MRRFAISDIHGCNATFKALLEKIDFRKEDILFLLGDYVDRGPDSRGVIDYIWQLQEEGYQVHCLVGNHEIMLLQAIEAKYDHFHGLVETVQSFDVTRAADIPKKYTHWIKNLPIYIEIEGYLLVHAGFNFREADPLSDKESMVWIRDWYQDIDKEWLAGRIIVHGHTPTPKDDIKLNLKNLDHTPVLDIDAGCVFEHKKYGYLCALNLDDQSLTFLKKID